jgi:hypothetical protein
MPPLQLFMKNKASSRPSRKNNVTCHLLQPVMKKNQSKFTNSRPLRKENSEMPPLQLYMKIKLILGHRAETAVNGTILVLLST